MTTLQSISVAVLAAVLLCGCSQQAPWTTGSVAPLASAEPAATNAAPSAANTTSGRLEHLAWNSAWAQSCGFYFDNEKLKESYLDYEATSGLPKDQLAKLSSTYDKAQAAIRAIAASHLDQCTNARLDKIRSAIARYLTRDFTPGEAA